MKMHSDALVAHLHLWHKEKMKMKKANLRPPKQHKEQWKILCKVHCCCKCPQDAPANWSDVIEWSAVCPNSRILKWGVWGIFWSEACVAICTLQHSTWWMSSNSKNFNMFRGPVDFFPGAKKSMCPPSQLTEFTCSFLGHCWRSFHNMQSNKNPQMQIWMVWSGHSDDNLMGWFSESLFSPEFSQLTRRASWWKQKADATSIEDSQVHANTCPSLEDDENSWNLRLLAARKQAQSCMFENCVWFFFSNHSNCDKAERWAWISLLWLSCGRQPTKEDEKNNSSGSTFADTFIVVCFFCHDKPCSCNVLMNQLSLSGCGDTFATNAKAQKCVLTMKHHPAGWQHVNAMKINHTLEEEMTIAQLFIPPNNNKWPMMIKIQLWSPQHGSCKRDKQHHKLLLQERSSSLSVSHSWLSSSVSGTNMITARKCSGQQISSSTLVKLCALWNGFLWNGFHWLLALRLMPLVDDTCRSHWSTNAHFDWSCKVPIRLRCSFRLLCHSFSKKKTSQTPCNIWWCVDAMR